ncbi:uncharacterized protein BXZ73DRAFT_95791 [Epithele typhae]|uniref:uncharacterized protein n=1 Tax=Epithele typhae TaxID=378194 RepID=UPI0020075962|nr:uncharacterized protein BXZ73DRAFT_95791 [Epithele typhae]KAH9946287.1 hypothetical protein BXZ73DRAFT_95791 [Epithele typhae]
MALMQAHQHAANADDYLARGLLIPAAEEHYKAAEAFQICVEASNDDNTKRTLRMLHNEHMKSGKDLQRKIAKLREENKDPSLPQKPTRSASGQKPHTAVPPPQPVPSPPPPPQSKLSDSQQTVDESFMLLGQRSDPGDAFHQFWKATEGMLDYLSRPVAFATAPLAPEDPTAKLRTREGSWSSDNDLDDPISKRISRGISLMKAAHSKMLTRYDSSPSTMESEASPGPSTFPPPPQPSHAFDLRDDWDDDIRAFEDDDMADSFCLIPSKADPNAASLKEENAALKAQLEQQQQKLANMELVLKARQEQDQQLRDSIMIARKEAHRAMISSNILQRPAQSPVDIASLNINVPTPPAVPAPVAPRDRDPQLVRRVRELEDEVRSLRVENEKQKAMIVRFRERWEKLKESAKRKKEAKAAADTTNVVGQRIEEDPEAEAAAERDDAHLSRSLEVAA